MDFVREISKKSNAPRSYGYLAAAVLIMVFFALSSFLTACNEDSTAVQTDEIVATVNGEEIYRNDFEQVLEQEKMEYQMQGVDFDSEEMSDTLEELEQHVLDNYFIIPTLIKQKAEEEGITVSSKEVEQRYHEYVAAFGGEEELLQQLEALNMTREDIDEDITHELLIQNYLDYYMDQYLENNPEEKVVKDEIEVTTEDLEEYYQQLRSDYNEIKELLEDGDPEMPIEQLEAYYELLTEQYGETLEKDDLEAIKPQLEKEIREDMTAQMKEEKLQRVISEHVRKLREQSDIEQYI